MLRHARRHFFAQYRAVYNACEEIALLCGLSPLPLAQSYMSRVTERETNADWWQSQGAYLAQPWFIWAYGQKNGLIPDDPVAAEDPLFLKIIHPEEKKHPGIVAIHLNRMVKEPQTGLLQLIYDAEDPAFQELLSLLYIKTQPDGFFRRVDRYAGPLDDRAAEAGVLLLERGFSVCVAEPVLADMILNKQFSEEKLYWVLAGKQSDVLYLRFPRDQKLYHYVYQAGGRWNGKRIEMAICHAEKLEELIRLYDFQVSPQARARLDLWHQALLQSTIFRQRQGKHRKAPGTADAFQQLLQKSIAVVTDLQDDND